MGLPGPEGARGVYGISVAAELVGIGAQNLRLYEARGLLEPERTAGGTRRYSANDLDRLRRISDLLEAGLNLAGIGMVLDLEAQNTQLREEKEDQQWLKTASIQPTRSPKADLLEQQTPLDEWGSLTDTESAAVASDSPAGLVDEADRLEQQTPVPGEDERRLSARAGRSRVVVMADPVLEAAVRVYAITPNRNLATSSQSSPSAATTS